jgi:protein involved in polysaccharide export with SLBB domain
MTPDRNSVFTATCLLAALLITFLAACASTPERASENDWVAIGDRIQVTDSHHRDEIDADVLVDIDGTVILPEIGTVQVAGHTASEIRELLVQRYSPYHDSLDIEVEITTGGKKYFVIGEVAGQGAVPLTGDVTIFEAVTTANPKPNSANLGRVRLIRADPRDPQVLIIDLSEGIDPFDVLIQDRDIIQVPAIQEPDPVPEPVPNPQIVPDNGSPVFLTMGGGRAR